MLRATTKDIKARLLSTASRVPDLEVDNIVIGAGVVGLAIGEKLTRARPTESTFVVEKNKLVGQETSSRNSEVIHAGLYYPEESLKTKLCIKGNQQLYQLCNEKQIPHKRLGKWIVAQDASQEEYLQQLHQKANRLNVPTYFLDQEQARRQEPSIRARSVLVSPSTGILSSHALMDYLSSHVQEVALGTEVRAIRPRPDGYLVQCVTNNESSWVLARRVFNAAGLHSHKVGQMLQLPYHLYFARGHYYRLSSKLNIRRLIYPCPEKNLAGLGTHLTLDLAGQIKFGPDVEYVEDPYDYRMPEDEDKKKAFVKAIQTYLPSLDPEKLYSDYSGIRPKLAGPGEPFKDFIIKEEDELGYNNFFTLIGIESPGLTSSLAIADHVYQLIRK
ncbi:hypothetical protein G6F57_007308 [Rhizopus arrhizus]|nr:hypothetical protein G6F23_009847 [Rhizopus arrhizus]KAG0757202.1 hypothetical protein G6F24_010638 [Rhizopus arrhizus]KAG0782178.1 hypothetical protein G6F21_011251 [Rhizopus arrhizus]KAG0787971.1 hypothetical protein G6F22_007147 [Rhizopus arrhizus]KAG0810637.1 hypothetical protein G6F20_007801 [Rhizopus arrhizus]